MTASGPVQVLPSLTVLVVDDNDVNQLYLQHLLRKNGHTPIPAVDGRQALAVVATHPVDCILMDIQLPDMDGMAVTKAIREGAGGATNPPAVPILALTAYAMPSDRQRCLAAGMDAHVAKPVRGPDLFAAIAQVLGWPRSDADSATVLDLSEFSQQGRQEFAAELLTLFLELAAPKGHALAEAVDRGDLAAAKGLAHDLAGMAGPLRAQGLGRAMRQLQEACQMGDPALCRQHGEQAGTALAAVLTAVRSHPLLAASAS